MQFKTIAALSLPVFGVLAAPHPQVECTSSIDGGYIPLVSSVSGVTTTTLALTLTVTSTYVHTATATATGSSSTSATSQAPASTPTSAYGIITARSGSDVHLRPWNAAGLRFFLGGSTASYCPESVDQDGACPAGETTAFLGSCSMDVEVPGGQQVYVTPSGEVGYTQAHSMATPPGSVVCPFTYSKSGDSSFGYVGLEPTLAFGASSFMACPTDDNTYQVFANLNNATVPQGDVTKCLGFDALAEDYTGGIAAWQYT